MKLERLRRGLLPFGLCTLVLSGAFLFLHTGARADGVCVRERFVAADGISLWPPGARCSFGFPTRTDVLMNPWLALVVFAIVFTLAVRFGQRASATR